MTARLYDELDRLISQSAGAQVGIAAHRLATGEEILINADWPFHPASTMKICVMMELFRAARSGQLSLEDLIPVRNEFVSVADGTCYSLSPQDDSETDLYDRIDASLPIRELMRRMIVVSSNLATNLLVQRVTPQSTTDFMTALGAHSLIVRRGVEDPRAFEAGMKNSGTARGFMQILIQLARREVISPEDSDQMIEILLQQQLNQMIPTALPAGLKIAHKTGSMAGHFHDVGIVFRSSEEPLIMALLTRRDVAAREDEAHSFVGSLAASIFRYWS